MAANNFNSYLGMHHEVIYKKSNNHDIGATVGYLKEPQKGP